MSLLLLGWASLFALVQAHAFGRKQGTHANLVEVLPEECARTEHGAEEQCCTLYLRNPTTVIGCTWGDLSKKEQETWQRLDCDRFKGTLLSARGAYERKRRTLTSPARAGAPALREVYDVPINPDRVTVVEAHHDKPDWKFVDKLPYRSVVVTKAGGETLIEVRR